MQCEWRGINIIKELLECKLGKVVARPRSLGPVDNAVETVVRFCITNTDSKEIIFTMEPVACKTKLIGDH